MMYKSLLLSVSMALVSQTILAQAVGSIEEKSLAIADQIHRDGAFLNRSQRIQIMEKLNSIQEILNGDSFGSTGFSNYICIDRDKDGRRPYVLATREGLQVNRIMGETFSSTAECESTLGAGRQLAGQLFICVSRDNDANRPFQIAALVENKINRISRTVVKTKEECETVVRTLKVKMGSTEFCTSRDNDGASPYIAVSMNLRTLEQRVGSETFRSMQDCQRFVNQ